MMKKNRIKQALCCVLLGVSVVLTGCQTMLRGDYTIEYLADETDDSKSEEIVEEDLDINIDYEDDSFSGDQKYYSTYPDAFSFLDNHSMNSEDIVSFQVLDFINNDTFVYAYQTMIIDTTIQETQSAQDAEDEAQALAADYSFVVDIENETQTVTDTMASVLMSYNYKTKEKKELWVVTSTATDEQSFFVQPIYKQAADDNKYQCTGYFAYFNGQLCLYEKASEKIIFQKNINKNLNELFNTSKESPDATYDIMNVTIDGNISVQLNIHVNMMIQNQDLENLDTDEDSEDVDLNEIGVQNLALTYSIIPLGNMKFTTQNQNYENQVNAWKNSTDLNNDSSKSIAISNNPVRMDNCIIEKGLYLYEISEGGKYIPRCAYGNSSEITNFINYEHILTKKIDGDKILELYGTIAGVSEEYIQNNRNITITSEDGKTQTIETQSSNFLRSRTFTFSNEVYSVSSSVVENDYSYTYLFGDYLVQYLDNQFTYQKCIGTKLEKDEIYEASGSNATENNIMEAKGISINDGFYTFLTDEDYLYLFNMSASKKLQISLIDICFGEEAEFTMDVETGNLADVTKETVDEYDDADADGEENKTPQNSEDGTITEYAATTYEKANPDIYDGDEIEIINGKWYICSLFSGLVTVDQADPTVITQISKYSCFGIYPSGTDYIVLGFDNDSSVYTSKDIAKAKCIPFQTMTRVE